MAIKFRNFARIIVFLTIFQLTLFISELCKANDYIDLSIEELMNIEVTSVSKRKENSFESPSAVYVVSQDDIKRSGATTIPEVLRIVPGIQVAQIDSNKWAITSRGFSKQFSNKLLVLIDGRSVYNPLFSGVYWDVQDVLLDDIDRIEVIRGPGATIWGANAVNGVINIITKNSDKTQKELLNIATGNHEKILTEGRYGGKFGENGTYRVYAKYNDRNNFSYENGGDAYDEWNVGRAGFRMDNRLNETDSLTIQGDQYNGSKDYLLSLASLSSPYTTTSKVNEQFSGNNILVNWNRTKSESSGTTVQFYYDQNYRDLPVFTQRLTTFDFDFSNSFKPADKHFIVWGAGFRRISDDLDDSPWISYSDTSTNVSIFSAFIQDRIEIVEGKVFLTPGTKLEHNDYTGYEIQPSARVSWLVSDKQTLWSSVARAVRTPSRNERDISLVAQSIPPSTLLGPNTPVALAVQKGNPTLEAEELTAYEIGYRINPNLRSSLDLSLFYNVYDKLRSSQLPGSPFFETNGFPLHLSVPIGLANNIEAKTYGFEVSSNVSLSENWRLSAGYGYINIDFDGAYISTDSIVQEGASPHHNFNVRSHFVFLDNFELDNTLYYVGELESVPVDSYVRFDTRIAWKHSEDLTISLVGLNLTDDHNEYKENLASQSSEIGRSIYGKVSIKF